MTNKFGKSHTHIYAVQDGRAEPGNAGDTVD